MMFEEPAREGVLEEWVLPAAVSREIGAVSAALGRPIRPAVCGTRNPKLR